MTDAVEKTPVRNSSPYEDVLQELKSLRGVVIDTLSTSAQTFTATQEIKQDIATLDRRINGLESRVSSVELQRVWLPMLMPTAVSILALAVAMVALTRADVQAQPATIIQAAPAPTR